MTKPPKDVVKAVHHRDANQWCMGVASLPKEWLREQRNSIRAQPVGPQGVARLPKKRGKCFELPVNVMGERELPTPIGTQAKEQP